jgi:hypothetical protein
LIPVNEGGVCNHLVNLFLVDFNDDNLEGFYASLDEFPKIVQKNKEIIYPNSTLWESARLAYWIKFLKATHTLQHLAATQPFKSIGANWLSSVAFYSDNQLVLKKYINISISSHNEVYPVLFHLNIGNIHSIGLVYFKVANKNFFYIYDPENSKKVMPSQL